MITWALLPVKRFDLGKSRLHEVLSQRELEAVNLNLFKRTLSTVKESGIFTHMMVISEDEAALDWASEQGFYALREERTGDLNSALHQALQTILANSGGPVLIIPTDLPMLTVEDLRLLAEYVPEENGILLVPDHHMTGTNALFFSWPDLMPTAFGMNSCALHCALAEERNLKQVIYLNTHIQHDLDTPEDLVYLRDSLN
ncbi:MAG: 2-phospho-L-lactate guanylyltransferase [Chloroflexi bacterium]|nr:2-phospho-L-lactate guanylyltransferase [Chloroflexota bacterium]